uniref:Radical SAM domain-containing protein n=1 Tax=Burkholderia phage vB_BgluM-SURPRISE13 TaxID=3159457 RepID=A0AAU7PFL0_9VIRU
MHRTVYIKTTEACNLNCKHCFTGGNSPKRDFLDVERTVDWVRRLFEHIDVKDHVHFELHGGEPFLLPVKQLKELTAGIRTWGPVKHSIGATTNLVYKLTDELLWFIRNDLESIGTSWDPGIRFANAKQENLWTDNMKRVVDVADVTLNVSVSRKLVEMNPQQLLMFLRDTGASKVQFERITQNGNALKNTNLFPTNAEINDWYLRLHNASEKLNAREWFYNAALEDVYAKFEKGNACSGTFCRDCEESIFTLNADGSIGGCANSAPEESFGHIDDDIGELFASPGRLDSIVKERVRNEQCYVCPVAAYCGGDCHRLAWEGDVCAAPRQLMKKLAGIPLDDAVLNTKRIIPIMQV